MESTHSKNEQAIDLMKRAEQLLHDKKAATPEKLRTMSDEEIWETLHNLQVHEIELAMQNEELRRVQAELVVSRARYFDLYDLAPVGYCTLSDKGIILEANLTATTLMKTAASAMVNAPFSRFIHREDQDIFYKLRRALYSTGKPYSCELRLQDSQGGIFWGQLDASAAQNTDGMTVFRILLKDVTERKSLEYALKVGKVLMETTLQSIGDGVISTDGEGKILYLNPVAEHLTGWTHAEAQGKPVRDVFDLQDESTGEKYEDITAAALAKRRLDELPTGVLVSRTGMKSPVEIRVSPILYEGHEVIGVVLGFRDFSERKKKQEEIAFLSYHDPLTGLYNRRFFDEELRRMDTGRNLPISIAMGDVNGLKLVNDAFGHAMGDDIIVKAARIIRHGCRTEDVVARLGGDEFIIILPKTDHGTALEVIQRIRMLLQNETAGSIRISISFGCATKSHTRESMQEILKSADNRMYRHKFAESPGIRVKTIDLILNMLFEKSHRERAHSRNVGEISAAIAARMRSSAEDIARIRITGILHDIGKIGISEKILNKPEALDGDERMELERKSEIGYRILSSVNKYAMIADDVLETSEKCDGSGYPKGLIRDGISIPARIVAIADAFDAMTHDQPHQKAMSVAAAVCEIRKCSGTHFDPDIASLFIAMCESASGTTDFLSQTVDAGS